MATIINTPGNNTPGNTDNGAGWSVAIIILIILIGLGAYFLLFNRGVPTPAPAGTDINVQLPAGTGGTGGTGGAGGTGGGTGTGTGGATTP